MNSKVKMVTFALLCFPLFLFSQGISSCCLATENMSEPLGVFSYSIDPQDLVGLEVDVFNIYF